ncbi:hypothetical protein AB4090_05975 [Acidithiobacillus sp. IBUN Pt1247-S3]
MLYHISSFETELLAVGIALVIVFLLGFKIFLVAHKKRIGKQIRYEPVVSADSDDKNIIVIQDEYKDTRNTVVLTKNDKDSTNAIDKKMKSLGKILTSEIDKLSYWLCSIRKFNIESYFIKEQKNFSAKYSMLYNGGKKGSKELVDSCASIALGYTLYDLGLILKETTQGFSDYLLEEYEWHVKDLYNYCNEDKRLKKYFLPAEVKVQQQEKIRTSIISCYNGSFEILNKLEECILFLAKNQEAAAKDFDFTDLAHMFKAAASGALLVVNPLIGVASGLMTMDGINTHNKNKASAVETYVNVFDRMNILIDELADQINNDSTKSESYAREKINEVLGGALMECINDAREMGYDITLWLQSSVQFFKKEAENLETEYNKNIEEFKKSLMGYDIANLVGVGIGFLKSIFDK